MLTINELEEAKTLLRIAAYDWKNEFEKTQRTSLRGLYWAAENMEGRMEEEINERLSQEKGGVED